MTFGAFILNFSRNFSHVIKVSYQKKKSVLILFYNNVFEILYCEKKSNFPSDIISALHFTIHKLTFLWIVQVNTSLRVMWCFKNKNNSHAIFKFWFRNYFPSGIILPKKELPTNEIIANFFLVLTWWSLYWYLFLNCYSSFDDFKAI